MGYLYLLLSSLCAITVAHLLKKNEVQGLRTLQTLSVNYLVAAVAAFLIGSTQLGGSAFAVWKTNYLLLFCGVVGVFFIGNFMVFSKSVHTNGVGITVTAMRLSLLVPVLISIFFYSESLDGTRVIGFGLVLVAFFLLIPGRNKRKIGNMSATWLLVITFFLSGFADVSLKIYQEEYSQTLNELLFMGWVFLAAFVIGFILCLIRRGHVITKKEAYLGCLVGIPNLYSAVFLIFALDRITGAVAFPLVNAMNVLGGTLLGLFVWNDRVSGKQWAGITTAILAIILLV